MNSRFIRNVVIKSLVLFLALDLIAAGINPGWLGRLSLYNHLFPGRQRFPFGEDSSKSYNLSLYNLDAMFASLDIAAAPKAADEYRAIVVGDSSSWGILQTPDETLSGQLNRMRMTVCGRRLRVYNLGYPTISLAKDLMVLDFAMRYDPDLVIWPVTLEAFPNDKQLANPLVANNSDRAVDLITRYQLGFKTHDPALIQPSLWDKTIIGQRRALADLFRLQLYGMMWAATGIDQTYPSDYPPAQVDLNTDVSFHGMQPPTQIESQLAIDVLKAGMHAAGSTPVILINEPMLISSGQNSNLRYNFLYPRWAYDQYRQIMIQQTQANGWDYLDLWNLVPSDQFTNSAIHLTPQGEALLANTVKQTILQQSCQ